MLYCDAYIVNLYYCKCFSSNLCCSLGMTFSVRIVQFGAFPLPCRRNFCRDDRMSGGSLTLVCKYIYATTKCMMYLFCVCQVIVSLLSVIINCFCSNDWRTLLA